MVSIFSHFSAYYQHQYWLLQWFGKGAWFRLGGLTAFDSVPPGHKFWGCTISVPHRLCSLCFLLMSTKWLTMLVCRACEIIRQWQYRLYALPLKTNRLRWSLFCQRLANAVEQSAWTPLATGHHHQTIQTIVVSVYVWLVGPRRPVSER